MTAQGSPLTRLRRALAGGDLLAARTAASDLPHVGLEEAAALLVLIARETPDTLDAAAVRFLGRACLERPFVTLDDAQLLVACLAQLEHGPAAILCELIEPKQAARAGQRGCAKGAEAQKPGASSANLSEIHAAWRFVTIDTNRMMGDYPYGSRHRRASRP